MPADVPNRVIADIRFIGRSVGAVKTLGGFKKRHHTLPDAANAVTNAFLGRLCEGELSEEAETLFQTVRTTLGYKRRELTLTLTSPLAVLTAKDFTLEILYALNESAPAEYAVTRTLLDLKDGDFARSDAFNAMMTGRFSELAFTFRLGASVEAIIDAIEGLDDDCPLRVDYPSDCSECTLSLPDVDAEVRCTAQSLNMVFPQAGAPRDLLSQFAVLRSAFRLNRTLAGLLG